MMICPTCKNKIDSDDYWCGNQCLRCALDEELHGSSIGINTTCPVTVVDIVICGEHFTDADIRQWATGDLDSIDLATVMKQLVEYLSAIIVKKVLPAVAIRRPTISDGFGNTWDAECPKCGGEMQVVRPGDARCWRCESVRAGVEDDLAVAYLDYCVGMKRQSKPWPSVDIFEAGYRAGREARR